VGLHRLYGLKSVPGTSSMVVVPPLFYAQERPAHGRPGGQPGGRIRGGLWGGGALHPRSNGAAPRGRPPPRPLGGRRWGILGRLRRRTFCRALCRGAELTIAAGQICQVLGHAAVHRARGEPAVSVGRPGGGAGEDLDAFVRGAHGPNVEAALADGVDDLFAEHEVADALVGDDDPLAAGEALGLADVVEALDLLVHAADGLDLAHLVHGPRDRDPLVDRQAREFAQERVEFGRAGAVTVDV